MIRIIPLSLLIVFYQFVQGQNTPCMLDITTDTINQTRKAQLNFSVIGKENNNLFCTAFRNGKVFSVYFGLELINKTVCFKPGSRAMVIFTDMTKIELINEQGENCKGNFLINSVIENKEFAEKTMIFRALSERVIKAIRFYSTEGYFDYDMSEDDDWDSQRNAEKFRRSLECLKKADL